VGRGFAEVVKDYDVQVLACSILPQHIHVVVARHRLKVERLVNLFKGEATKQLNRERIHPLATYSKANGTTPSPWAQGGWRVYLNDAADIRRAIRYVEQNPIKDGKPAQRWNFVASSNESHSV